MVAPTVCPSAGPTATPSAKSCANVKSDPNVAGTNHNLFSGVLFKPLHMRSHCDTNWHLQSRKAGPIATPSAKPNTNRNKIRLWPANRDTLGQALCQLDGTILLWQGPTATSSAKYKLRDSPKCDLIHRYGILVIVVCNRSFLKLFMLIVPIMWCQNKRHSYNPLKYFTFGSFPRSPLKNAGTGVFQRGPWEWPKGKVFEWVVRMSFILTPHDRNNQHKQL